MSRSGASRKVGYRFGWRWVPPATGRGPLLKRAAHRSCFHGSRRAKLFLGSGDTAFACRACHDLAYASQSEIPTHRAITKAQKLRMRLGGGPSLLEPFPGKPRRMHRRTYLRRLAAAIAAQECSIALELAWLRRPPSTSVELLSEEPVAEV